MRVIILFNIFILVLIGACFQVRKDGLSQESWQDNFATMHADDSFRAELVDRTVSVEPALATFRLPVAWLNWHARHGNNIHLTRRQLAEVENAEGDWDEAYAAIVNGVLPYANCLAHLGGEGWGNNSAAYSDLQMRLYVGNWPSHYLRDRLSEEQMSLLLGTEAEASLTHATEGAWQKYTVRLPVFYEDYGGVANVNFYSRHMNNHEIILVFMYSDYSGVQINQLRAVLQSFG